MNELIKVEVNEKIEDLYDNHPKFIVDYVVSGILYG